jgi:NAD(P)-dependent dehydrogenase (short-subunit alcohol dehydrogenase family)
MGELQEAWGLDARAFSGRTAVVTGGTDGLGEHLVRTLAAMGARVFFCGRRRDAGDVLAARLGPGAVFIQCDLADMEQLRQFAARVAGQTGQLDYLVNNAAIDPRITFTDATPDDFDRLIAINLRPFYFLTQALLPLLRRGEGKAIVNIGTTNYMLGLSPFTLYNASKAGILGFTRSLARELGGEGIRVNMLSPGWIMTDKQLREHVSEADQRELLDEQSLKFLLKSEHVTPATLFLLSPAAAAITGQNLVVDGGKVMR